MIYSYHISHPSDLRHDVRKNFEDFLAGTQDDTADERPFEEQTADLLSELDLFTRAHAKPEQAPETELE